MKLLTFPQRMKLQTYFTFINTSFVFFKIRILGSILNSKVL